MKRLICVSLSSLVSLALLTSCNDLSQILGTLPHSSPSPTATASPSAVPSTIPVSSPSPAASPSTQPVGSGTNNGGFVDHAVQSVGVPSKFVKPVFPLSTRGNGSLSLSKNYFKPGKPIELSFQSGNGFDDSAWIGIIPSTVPHGEEPVNDQNDITYQTIHSQPSGLMTFTAPGTEQNFDFRMHATDTGGTEANSITFTVTRELPPEEMAAVSMSLVKERYKPGKPIVLRFTAPASFDDNAWIGMIPAEVAHGEEALNDQHDMTYQQIKSRTSGEMTFTAPGEGRYDFRMHDNDTGGKEACYVSFIVTRDLPAEEIAASSLSLNGSVYKPGEKITLHFTAAATFDKNAWIGIVPSEIQHGEEALNDQHDLTYQSVDGKTSGDMTFYAPSTPGRYDFRMNDTDSGGKEVTSVSFTVSG